MNRITIIAFTHKNVEINTIGKLHIDATELKNRLSHLKISLGLTELMYLSTCNRVEFVITHQTTINTSFLTKFFTAFNPEWLNNDISWAAKTAQVFNGIEAVEHLFNVAASLDSLVVGEREIITQVRNAYDECHKIGITGDTIRLLIKKTIEAAKEIYTHTQIAAKPVSIVSLAYRKLRELNIKADAKFLIIGTGITNTTMTKYLSKYDFKNFSFFNRTYGSAEKLAKEVNGTAYPLSELKNHNTAFDVLITCTGASEFIVSKEIYAALIKNDTSEKIVIDLAIPNDFDPEILNNNKVQLISINSLQAIAKENLNERQQEIEACNAIINRNLLEFKHLIKTRKVEQLMQTVPKKIKEIEQLDEQAKDTLNKVLGYIEKKYISLPMKMAKEILTQELE